MPIQKTIYEKKKEKGGKTSPNRNLQRSSIWEHDHSLKWKGYHPSWQIHRELPEAQSTPMKKLSG